MIKYGYLIHTLILEVLCAVITTAFMSIVIAIMLAVIIHKIGEKQ